MQDAPPDGPPPEPSESRPGFRSVKMAKRIYDRVWIGRQLLLERGATALPEAMRRRLLEAVVEASGQRRHKTIGLSTVVELAMDLLFDALEAAVPRSPDVTAESFDHSDPIGESPADSGRGD